MKFIFAKAPALTKACLHAPIVVTILFALLPFKLLLEWFLLDQRRSIAATRMYRSLSDRGSFTEYVYVLPVDNRPPLESFSISPSTSFQVIRSAPTPFGHAELHCTV